MELVSYLSKELEKIIKSEFAKLNDSFSEIHRHIDFIQRDMLIVLQNRLQFIANHNISLQTDYPVAIHSNDHISPWGTAADNTRYPRFIKKCELLFEPHRDLSFLDLGCSGGGMVLEALLRNHFALGLEGSDYSLKYQRAEWRLLQKNLFTCDISKEFSLITEESQIKQFEIITAWEVLEHINESDLPQLFKNIKKHLKTDGYFISSVASWDDINPKTGLDLHVTKKPKEWWHTFAADNGFYVHEDLLQLADLARGGSNPPLCYMPTRNFPNPINNFPLFLSLKK